MTIPDAVELVIEAADKGGAKTYILDMGEPVNVYELAKSIVKDESQIEIIGTRPGETLSEELMTAEEKLVAKKVGKFYVI